MVKRMAESEDSECKEELVGADTKEQPHDESNGRKQRRPQQKKRKVLRPLYRAGVVRAATTASAVVADDAIISKIRKCLDRGNHPETPEHEAKAALHLASRWMAMHNVSQAQMLEKEKAEDLSKHSGQCDVAIVRADGDARKPVNMQGHVGMLCSAVHKLFDCKSYPEKHCSSLVFAFYGIEANAMAAADAFEMVFNRVAEWSMKYKRNGPRESYCLGISDELYSIAGRTKRAEELEAQKKEEAIRIKEEEREVAEEQARLSRLSPAVFPRSESMCDSPQSVHHQVPPAVTTESEVDSDEEHSPLRGELDEEEEDWFEPTFHVGESEDAGPDIYADLDETIDKLVKKEARSPTHAEVCAPSVDVPDANSPAPADAGSWASHHQLVLFRDTAKAIADEYIKSKGIKFHAARKRTHMIRDWDVYVKSQCDGHKIDLRSSVKRIEASKEPIIKEEHLSQD